MIHTEPSPTATAGQAFATGPVIYEEDKFGNLETVTTARSSPRRSSGSGPLTGATVTVSGGVATFVNLADDTAETISLNFSGGGLTAGPSSSVVITPAAASKLSIQTEPSGSATAGQPLAIQPVIREEDQYGNLEIGDNSTVITVSLAGGTGTLHGTATVSGGVATFTGLTDDTAGTFTLKFTGPGLTTATSTPITVIAAPATQLVVTTAPPDPIIAGQAFVMVVAAEDQFKNVDTTYSGNVSDLLAHRPERCHHRAGQERPGHVLRADAADDGPGRDDPGDRERPERSGDCPRQRDPAPGRQHAPAVADDHRRVGCDAEENEQEGQARRQGCFRGVQLVFSTAMNPSTAGLAGNYQVDAMTTKREKKKTVVVFKPVTSQGGV